MKIADRRKDQFYHSLFKTQGNALVRLIIASYAERSKPADKLSRAGVVTKTEEAIRKRNRDGFVF